MEIRKCENSVRKLLNGYTKTEVFEIVEGVFKAKQADSCPGYGHGGKKRGLEEDEEQPPLKKRLNNVIIDSLKAHIHPFLENRPPPKLKIMSFAEAIANLPNPKLNQKTKTKPTPRCSPPLSRTTLPLTKVVADRQRPTEKISAPASKQSNTRSKSKPSTSKKEITRLPQIPRRISPDLHEHQAAPKPPPMPPQVLASEQSIICFGKANGTSITDEISPRRAARAAELKKRFAAIISKAQDRKLFGGVSTNVKQKEEEAEAQLKSIRKRERELARLALVKVEEAADGRDNMQIFKEFQALCDCDLEKYPNGLYSLEQFGLILKH